MMDRIWVRVPKYEKFCGRDIEKIELKPFFEPPKFRFAPTSVVSAAQF